MPIHSCIRSRSGRSPGGENLKYPAFIAALNAAALLCGCSTDINVRAEWGKGIANFGLRPEYPLKENLHLGDILLFVHNPCDGEEVTKVPQTMLLGSLPENEIELAFARYYGNRPQLPVTPSKGGGATDKPKTPPKPAT